MKEYINKIYHGNSAEVMLKLPKESVDLIVTSPPYDNLKNYEGYSFDIQQIVKGIDYVLKDGGVVVWIVADETIRGSETCTSFRQAIQFVEQGFNLHDTMIWYKPNTFNFGSNKCYRQSFEYMFVFSKGVPATINLIKDVPTKSAGQEFHGYRRHPDREMEKTRKFIVDDYKRRDNVWTVQIGQERSEHPAIFPEALARDHIITWSNKNDIVLDPMCGAGTTCKMAKELGRKFIGIDISKKYCDIAQRRVNSTLMKTTLDEYNKALRGEEQ